MDYLDIVLKGYFTPNNREHLSKYFFREFKKAEKDYYEADEFFSGCLNIIEVFENDIDQQLNENKNNLHMGLALARQGLKGLERGIPESELKRQYDFAENKGLTYEQLCKKTISECEEELKELSRNNFSVHLHSITKGKFAGSMFYDEMRYIKEAILEAREENLPDQKEKNMAKKEYKSIARVRAFYLVIMQREGKISAEDMESRRKIMEIADNEFPKGVKTASRQVYNQLREDGICLQFLDQKIRKFEAVYNFGLSLYKMKYPDT